MCERSKSTKRCSSGGTVSRYLGSERQRAKDSTLLYDANLPLVETHAEARHFRLGEAACAHQLRPWREPIPEPGATRTHA